MYLLLDKYKKLFFALVMDRWDSGNLRYWDILDKNPGVFYVDYSYSIDAALTNFF